MKVPAASKHVLSAALPFRSGGDAVGLPQRVKILAWGLNIGRTTGARIVVDDHVAATLAANQELVAIDRVPLDYEHQSVKGHPNFKEDPRHSPGDGIIEVVPGEGVFLTALEYTPNGRLHAESYRDLSAVVHLDAQHRPLWISSVALTKTGDVAGMEFADALAVLSARAPGDLPHNDTMTTDPQSDKTAQEETVYRALLVQLLGLKPAEGETEISDEAIRAAVEAKAASTEHKGEEGKPAATAALSARLDRIEKQNLLSEATRAGKVVPLSAQDVDVISVAALAGIISRCQAGEVPLSATAQTEKPAPKTAALSADQAKAAKALGLTEEDYRKAL